MKVYDTPKPSGDPAGVYRTSLARDGRSVKVEEFTQVGRRSDPFATIRCANERYAFLLEKPTEDSAYLIRDLSSPERGETVEALRDLYAVHLGPYAAFSQRIAAILARPDTRLTDAVRVDRGDRSLVRIHFEFRLTPRDPLCPAWILLSPDEGWILEEYEGMFGTKHDRPRRGRVEYDVDRKGRRLPRRVVFEHSTSCWVYEIERIDVGKPSDPEDFTLAAYGLPEPAEPPSKMRIAYWLFAGAVVCLIGAIVARRSARRLDRRVA
jgi:hypothetical protein